MTDSNLQDRVEALEAELARVRQRSRRALFIAVAVACALLPLASSAVPILKTWMPNDPIRATEINDNFQKLSDAIDTLERVAAGTRLASLEQGPVVAQYWASTQQSLPSSAEQRINFDTQGIDTHSAVSIGGDWAFTAPRDGYYETTVTYDCRSGSGRACYVFLLVGGRYIAHNMVSTQTDFAVQPFVTTVAWLNKGDRLYANAWTNASGGSVFGQTPEYTYIAIHEVR